jgi:ribosomal protein L30/L7E
MATNSIAELRIYSIVFVTKTYRALLRALRIRLIKSTHSTGRHSAPNPKQLPVRRLRIHRVEEIRVVLRLLQLVDQELDRIRRTHRRENTPQYEDLLKILARDKEVFLSRP